MAVDKVDIQPNLDGFSASSTMPIFDISTVERARSTVHSWIHNADLQPETGQNPNLIAVDETVVLMTSSTGCTLSSIPCPTNHPQQSLRQPEPARIVHAFVCELREKHAVDNVVFLIDGTTPLQTACRRHGLAFRLRKARQS
jgi:hypothetical protein